MNSRKTRLILAVAVAAAIFGYKALNPKPGAAGDSPQAAADPAAAPVAPILPVMLGKIAFSPCSISSPMAKDSLDAMCATYAVPEDRAAPGGRKIALNIAWLQPRGGGEQLADPVFFLAGGPGQAAVATYPPLDPVFREVRKQRSVILVDQRGTGKSNLLSCESADDSAADLSPAASS